VDEIVTTQDKIFKNLVVNLDAVKQNLNKYAPFAATERILMELVKRGADRQLCHEKLREHSMKAWQAIQDNPNNPLLAMVCRDDDFRMFLSEAEIVMLFDINDYIGVASEKANMTSLEILQTLELNNSSL
jgi:adenylosuccinate lyase